MIGSNDKKPSSSSIYNRSYTIHTDFPIIKPNPNSSSIQRSESFKKFPPSDSSPLDSIKGKVRNICSLFESRKTSKFRLPGTEDRVVVYFTSLRGIRRTYEDCYSVRMILKFFRVFIDERDISMDSSFRKELVTVLGGDKKISLPQVFIKGNYVGGVDVIKQFHENGQLGKLLNGLPVRSIGAAWQVCEACGDVRFVPCVNCCGSKKVFDEDDDKLKRCPDCNENGLIRCSTCCSSS